MSNRNSPMGTLAYGTYVIPRNCRVSGITAVHRLIGHLCGTAPIDGGPRKWAVEELADSPDLGREALRSVAGGRVVHLVRGDHEHVADIVPDGALEELEETVEVLADSEAVRALIEAREAAARGDVVRGVDAVRALLEERRDSAV